MKSIDQEWRELTELYSQMSEGELQALANEAYDLTDMARDALRGEISRRGLHMQVQDQPAPTEVDQNYAPSAEFDPAELDLEPFGRVFNIDEARRIKSIFDNGGVLSYFGPDHVENIEELKAAFEPRRRSRSSADSKWELSTASRENTATRRFESGPMPHRKPQRMPIPPMTRT
jgi:hypothetical protein